MESKGNIFVLTGAGISAESGVPVFQGTNWRGRPHFELANIECWERDPALVWEYYSERRARARGAKPNPAHVALAEFGNVRSSANFFLCTQNVDGLHEAAGSKNVAHIHGKLFETRCSAGCGAPPFADHEGYQPDALPRCRCGTLLRPSVCWFGEQPYDLDRIYTELERCTLFFAIGTSGSVQPVASFVAMLKGRPKPARTIYAGLDEPSNAAYFDEVHLGPASVVVRQVLSEIK
jgi:NAD-dependent deacetylase